MLTLGAKIFGLSPYRNASHGLFTKTVFTVQPLISANKFINTVYQNTTGRPVIVTGSVETGGGHMTAFCDASPTPSTVVSEGLGFGNQWFPFTFVVPNGFYYEITGLGGASLQTWVEFKINNGTVGFSGDIAGSRLTNTVYHNTSGGSKLVVVNCSSGGSGTIQMVCDSSSSPTTVVGDSVMSNGGPYLFPMVMLVPNGYYYKVVGSGVVGANWNEYNFPFQAVQSLDLVGTRSLDVTYTDGSEDLWIFMSGSVSGFGQVNAVFAAPSFPTTPDTIWSTWPGFDAYAWGIAQPEDQYSATCGGSSTLSHWFEYQLS